MNDVVKKMMVAAITPSIALVLMTSTAYAGDLFGDIGNAIGNLGHTIDNTVKDTFGHIDFDHGGTVHAPRVVDQAWRETAGQALAQGIWMSRNGIACQAVPPQYAQALIQLGVNPNIVQRACYSTDWGAAANGTIQQFLLGNEIASAVTLDNLIVFRDGRSVGDLALWVHELKHVEQYATMGVLEFAKHYVSNSGELENPAYAAQNQAQQILAQGSQQTTVQPMYMYFNINGGLYLVDGNGFTYPADPYSGRAVGPANGRMVSSMGNQAQFLDSNNRNAWGVRVR